MNFLELNIQFQEEYKRLDLLCKDMLSSTEGVSEYLRQMEIVSFSGQRLLFTWETDYKNLKHYRWIRNQLAHEVGTLNSEFCTYSDIEWITTFYQRVLATDDPLSMLRKIQREENRTREKVETESIPSQSKVIMKNNADNKEKEKVSFWKRIARKFKSLFH